MADSLRLATINSELEYRDQKTGRTVLSGNATVAVEYGDIAFTVELKFDHLASHTEAAVHVLRQIGNIGHFIEYRAGDLEREYKRRIATD